MVPVVTMLNPMHVVAMSLQSQYHVLIFTVHLDIIKVLFIQELMH